MTGETPRASAFRDRGFVVLKGREELGYSPLDPELVERLRRAGLYGDVDPLPHDSGASSCRPGQLQKLVGRRIRPGARAA